MASVQSNHTIGQPFILLDSVDSTNNYAHDKLHAKLAAHGYTVFAKEQFAGRGQHGKTWVTEPGTNMIVSILLDVSFISLHKQFFISAATALAAYDLFSAYAGDDTRIKWPNDIYWQNRKAGGILVELTKAGRQKFAVAGFGMNINQTKFLKGMGKPVSLKQITGKDFDPVKLSKKLFNCLENRYKQLSEKRFDELLNEYNAVLFKKGETVKLKKNNIAFEGVIEGVNANGQLLVNNALQHHFSFGEVEWVI